MHEIPPLAEQLLRAQGVTDAELDELRRTGTLRRGDGSGNSIDIQIADGTPATTQASSISVDGISLNGAMIPPAALEKLTRYHRFMPDHVVQNIELATGQDIDGDGQVGGGGSNPAPPSHAKVATGSTPAHAHVGEPTHGYQVSGALPTGGTGTSDGPFVQKRVGGKLLLPIILALLALGAVTYVVIR